MKANTLGIEIEIHKKSERPRWRKIKRYEK